MAGGAAAGIGQPGTQGGMPAGGVGQPGTQTGSPQTGAGAHGPMPTDMMPNFDGGAFTPPMGGMTQQGPGVTVYTPQQGAGIPFGQVLQQLGMARQGAMPGQLTPQDMPQDMLAPVPTAQSMAQNISPGIAGLQSALTGRPVVPSNPAVAKPVATPVAKPAPTPVAKPAVAPKPQLKQTPINTKKPRFR